MSTMSAILDLCDTAHPDHVALTLDDQQVSFGAVARFAGTFASALWRMGVRRGDVVLSCCATSFEHVYLNAALARVGAIFAPADPASSADALSALVQYVRPSMLVTDGARQALVEAIARHHHLPLAVVGPVEGARAGLDLASGGAPIPSTRDGQPEDIHALYFTSGSTGQSKAVAISHRANWLRAYLAASLTSSGGMVSMFPLFHMAGWQVIAQSWTRRRPVHLVRRADAESLLGAVERWRASTLYAIPAVWRRILDCRGHFDLECLRSVDAGTSYVGPELIAELRARFPRAHNMIGYGSTEIGAALQLAHEDIERKPGSVGLPAPAIEARIVEGELQLRGPTMMHGYFRLPTETADAFDSGWYKSGDLVERDADGFYAITGRRREIIRSGGETVSPAELDALLRARIDDVDDLAVVGLPHADWGEMVCVAIVLKQGAAALDLEGLRSQLTDIHGARQPRALARVPYIPRTPATGQVRRGQLKEMILAQSAGR